MTDLTRRTVLAASAVATAVAAVGLPASGAAAADARAGLYLRRRFTRLRGKKFLLSDGSRTWAVKLTHVQDLEHAARGAQRSFALRFRRATPGPPQGTYTLRRKGFSPTVLFVVPSDARRRSYEVVVN